MICKKIAKAYEVSIRALDKVLWNLVRKSLKLYICNPYLL